MKEYYPWELTFDLYIDTSSSFSHPQIIKDIQDTAYTSNYLAEGKTYFWKVLAKNLAGDSLWSKQQDWGFFIKQGATSVKNDNNEMPQNFELFQNYPNPFNSTTQIRFQLPSFQKVSLKILNLMGREVRTLVNEQRPSGSYQILWDGKDNQGNETGTGVYLCVFQAGGYVESRKVLILR
jgi:hypothetical protein